MAEPMLETDRRLDRIETALGTIAKLTLGEPHASEIERILRGEKSETPEADTDS